MIYFFKSLLCLIVLNFEAYRYIVKQGGLDSESSYPYIGHDGQCHFRQEAIAASIRSYVHIAEANETQLTLALALVGPVAVGIDAGESSFQFYSSGVYYDLACSAAKVDHLALAVGYGVTTTTDKLEFYVVKNSWGTAWGENGYIRMSRNKNDNCGIASFASYPVL